jgi:predicted pyridoxine 5'-phosphate oxidase superfamily flavin-nucleotide-binding protein
MLTAEIQDAINHADLLPFATATPDGTPNVVPVKYVWVAGPDTVWIADNYFDKTLVNLRANPQAALYVWSADPKRCVQIKGDIRIYTEGADFEMMRARARAEKPDIPARSLVTLQVREIFQCLPGDGPGRRLWPAAETAP